ncbi:MAG: hypothetical protein MI866_14870 [Bacteroidales bacterium]|uniref:hypothetical protein n=1 Tax=Carboxylicivirga agarovorans TaxID=3417570 RepID=UPI003D33ECF5|nr:hypothetical protein [Bacteroidales bacterium]
MTLKKVLAITLLLLFLVSSILGFFAVFEERWIRSSVLFGYSIAILFFNLKLINSIEKS